MELSLKNVKLFSCNFFKSKNQNFEENCLKRNLIIKYQNFYQNPTISQWVKDLKNNKKEL